MAASDISGCATAELAAVFHGSFDGAVNSREWAHAHLPSMDERDFEKVVDEQRYPFTGLRILDNILHALGLNLNTLTSTGEITIVPSNALGAARKMVREEIAASMELECEGDDEEQFARLVTERMRLLGRDEIDRRVQTLVDLRIKHCEPSAAQLDLLRRDAKRTIDRRERQRAA